MERRTTNEGETSARPESQGDGQQSSGFASQIDAARTLQEAVVLDRRLALLPQQIEAIEVLRLRTLLEKRFVDSTLVALFLMGQDGTFHELVEALRKNCGEEEAAPEVWLSDLGHPLAERAVQRASEGPRVEHAFSDLDDLAEEILVCRTPDEASRLVDAQPALRVPGVDAPRAVMDAVHEVSARVIVSATHRRYLTMAAALMESGLWNDAVEHNLKEDRDRLTDAGLEVYEEQRRQGFSRPVPIESVGDWLEMEAFLGALSP